MANKSYYYNIKDDLIAYPDAIFYIVIGGRNTGKTYGMLKTAYEDGKKIAFVKRTNDDVDLLCGGGAAADLSPYKSINRDMGTNIRASKVGKGIGIFAQADDEGNIAGGVIGYLLSLNAIQKFKGFDLSDADYLVFDECIPQPWERINRREGEQILDIYKTISRDREHRGSEPLKLCALANATEISNPICNILELTDVIADMQVKDIETYYDNEKGIFVRLLQPNAEFIATEKNSKLYKAMGNTQWGKMAFGNEFGYNDFSNVKKQNLKGFRCYARLKFKEKYFYVYYNEKGQWHICHAAQNHYNYDYNLNLENDQKAFNIEIRYDLTSACIDGRVTFETYTMYDLIINYKKYFRI